jgi:hypothetical protein
MAGTVDIDPLHAAEQGIITESASPESPDGEMDGAAASQAWDAQQSAEAEPIADYGAQRTEGTFIPSNAPGEPDDPSPTVPRNPYTNLPGDPNAGLPEQKDPPPWYGVTVDAGVGAITSAMSPATRAQLLTRSIFALQRRLALQPNQLPPALQTSWSQFVTGWAALCRPLVDLPAVTRIHYWDTPALALTVARFLARFQLLCAAVRAYLPPLPADAATDADEEAVGGLTLTATTAPTTDPTQALAQLRQQLAHTTNPRRRQQLQHAIRVLEQQLRQAAAVGGLFSWLFHPQATTIVAQGARQLTADILALQRLILAQGGRLPAALASTWQQFVSGWDAFCHAASGGQHHWWQLPQRLARDLTGYFTAPANARTLYDFRQRFNLLQGSILAQLQQPPLVYPALAPDVLPPLAPAPSGVGGLKNWIFDTDLGQEAGVRARGLTSSILEIQSVLKTERDKLDPGLNTAWQQFVKEWTEFCASVSRNDIAWYDPRYPLAQLKAMWGSKATYNAVADFETRFDGLDQAISAQLGHEALAVPRPKPLKKAPLDRGDDDKKGGWGFWGTAAVVGLGGLGVWFLYDAVTARGRTYGNAFRNARDSFASETDRGAPIFAREVTRPRAVSRGHMLPAPGY